MDYRQILEKNKLEEFQKFSSEIINTNTIDFIDYIAVGMQNKAQNFSQSIMSNQEWYDNFRFNQLFKEDPVRRAITNIDQGIVYFNSIILNKREKEIMDIRKKHNINQGFVIVTPSTNNPDIKYCFTFASSSNNIKIYDVITRNSSKIKQVCHELSDLI